MSLSKESIKKFLGIKEPIYLTPQEMAKHLKVTFFPAKDKQSDSVINFIKKLKKSLLYWGVRIIPYEKSTTQTKDGKIKIKENIVVISTAIKGGDLPIEHLHGVRSNLIATVINNPFSGRNLPYEKYLAKAMTLFSWHMSNVIISVDKRKWRIYNLNGVYPQYEIGRNFNRNILYAVISKLATPIRPLFFSDFIIRKEEKLGLEKPLIRDFIRGSRLLDTTGLFPSVIKLHKLKFRNQFHKIIASLYLDKRSGLSYGFIAKQLPLKLPKVKPLCEVKKEIRDGLINKDYYISRDKMYVLINIKHQRLFLSIPPVWVVTTRSGCEKTKLDINKDLISIGLINGKMILFVPKTVSSLDDYRPSFDTRVILAHAVANAIYGAVLKYLNPEAKFPDMLQKKGVSIVHWHGYINKKFAPLEWLAYGRDNPAVSCSSPHTAIYAFRGKHWAVNESLSKNREYLGDIHIEPQHGINITCDSIIGLANFLQSRPCFSALGNRYE